MADGVRTTGAHNWAKSAGGLPGLRLYRHDTEHAAIMRVRRARSTNSTPEGIGFGTPDKILCAWPTSQKLRAQK